jgi:two-component system, OmpR family, response regulator
MPTPKHILVVEDDSDVRQVIADQLEELGYRVSLADNGETMRAFLQTLDPIDLIVLDGVMPGEQSESLALHAAERKIRLVMISGSPEHMQKANSRADQLLAKPFRSADLKRAVEAALASDTFGQRRTYPE